ncbi:MAG: helix-hairpin-helix domain-containing protein [Phycisphaerae bacterium]|nr:helix-hairpin-helix domain-containing protein [Phycisphaerae bacterium]
MANTGSPSPSSSPLGTARSGASQRILAIVLAGVMIWALASTPLRVPAYGTGPAGRAGELRCGVNPNTAPWWEFVALPGVGVVTAHSIVDYRDDRAAEIPVGEAVFRCPADLDAVPGIGPTTIARIVPHLILTGGGALRD